MPRLASGGSPPAARCAAGPRTRRDDRPPGLPARAAIYPRALPVRRDGDIAPYRHYTRVIRTQYPIALAPAASPVRLAARAPISFLWSEEIFPDRIKITFYWTPIPVPSIFVPTIFLFLFR